MKLYFRTRILTFLFLIVILCLLFIFLYQNIDDLSVAYDSTSSYLLMLAVIVMLFWIGVDLYWSIAVRTYKDSKQGKQGRQAA